MYRELTSRVLLGGFVSRNINPEVLIRGGVTHIVNSTDQPLPRIISQQFWAIDLKDANYDGEQPAGYWPEVFQFTRHALKKRTNILYFHVTPEVPSRPASPVAVYAALRAMGFSPLESRNRLLEAHPFVIWYENAIGFVDAQFNCWCRQHHVKMHCTKTTKHRAEETALVDVGEMLDGAMEWTQ